MNQQQEAIKAKEFFDECHSILVKKANDYAQDHDCFSNFKKIALICDVPVSKVFLMFITVKIARLVELSTKTNKVNESKRDSLKDIANYANLMSLYEEENATTPD
jgi:hypothetical protein